MTRIPLATDLKTRTGAPDKDARLTNCYVETRGDQSVVRKRAVAQGGVSVGTGVAQGGIGLHINGVDYIYTVNGDVGALNDISVGTTWNSGTSYSTGDHVSYGFNDYSALIPNDNKDPTTEEGAPYWEKTGGDSLVACSLYFPYQGYGQSISSDGPYETDPSLPDDTHITTKIKKFSCGILTKHVVTTYAKRTIANQWKVEVSWYQQNYSSGNWIPEYDSGVIVKYGNTVNDAVNAAAATISPPTTIIYVPGPSTYDYTSPSYSATPPSYAFIYTNSFGTHSPMVVTSSLSSTQMSIYYIDTTITIYYTVE